MFKHFGKGKSSPSQVLELEEKIHELDMEVTGRIEENDLLRTENEELKATIKNMTFNDVEHVFSIPMKSDFFFGRVKVSDAIELLKNMQKADTVINFGYEVVEE